MGREVTQIQSIGGHVLVRDDADPRRWRCATRGCPHQVVTPRPDQPRLAAEMDIEGCPARFRFVGEPAAA